MPLQSNLMAQGVPSMAIGGEIAEPGLAGLPDLADDGEGEDGV
jgi:hypothetical protein